MRQTKAAEWLALFQRLRSTLKNRQKPEQHFVVTSQITTENLSPRNFSDQRVAQALLYSTL